MMTAAVVSMDFDIEKQPLGELQKSTLLQALACLKEIEEVILKKKKGDLSKLSGQFYTMIPHNFGFQKMSCHIIANDTKLKAKLQLVQSLLDVQEANEISKSKSKTPKTSAKKVEVKAKEPNLTDQNYEKLNCKITPIDEESKDFAMIDQYVQNGKDTYYKKLEIIDAFHLERDGEAANYNPNNLSNKQLLWHGSRFSNFSGILSQGMRIAPPEAPSTGYAFGKGVYCADQVKKSVNYSCYHMSNNIATLLLLELACGDQYETKNWGSFKSLPKGKNSTKYVCKSHPNPAESQTWFGDVNVPCGKLTKFKDDDQEFIVYNTNQVKMRYLIRVKVSH